MAVGVLVMSTSDRPFRGRCDGHATANAGECKKMTKTAGSG